MKKVILLTTASVLISSLSFAYDSSAVKYAFSGVVGGNSTLSFAAVTVVGGTTPAVGAPLLMALPSTITGVPKAVFSASTAITGTQGGIYTYSTVPTYNTGSADSAGAGMLLISMINTSATGHTAGQEINSNIYLSAIVASNSAPNGLSLTGTIQDANTGTTLLTMTGALSTTTYLLGTGTNKAIYQFDTLASAQQSSKSSFYLTNVLSGTPTAAVTTTINEVLVVNLI